MKKDKKPFDDQSEVKSEDKSVIRSGRRKKKTKKPFGKTIFFVILLTLFFGSFATTAYIIINANQLTFRTEPLDSDALIAQIEELEAKIAEKDILIEDLTLQNSTIASSSPTPTPTKAPQSGGGTPKPSQSAPSASPTPSASPSESPEPTSTKTPDIVVPSDIDSHTQTQTSSPPPTSTVTPTAQPTPQSNTPTLQE